MADRFERLKEEVGKVRASMYGDNTGYAAARAVLRQALEAVQSNRVSEAEKLLKQAQALVEREKGVMHRLKEADDRREYKEGHAGALIKEAEGHLKEGELEQAERMLEEIYRAVEEENRAYARVKEAEQLISQRLAGAKIEEAQSLVAEALEALKKGSYSKAGELAEQAKLAAKPTTEYLLTRAKELADKAREAFEAERYEEAISLWRDSISEYDRAREVAEERGEREIVERVEAVVATLEENIAKAEVAIDNREMLALIEEANRLVEEAEKSYSAEEYDAAKEKYTQAKQKFREAEKLAEKRGFEEKEEIEKAIASAEESIDSCLLAKGRALLDSASALLEENKAKEAEQAFANAMSFLEGIEVARKAEKQAMLAEARQGLVEAKIYQARQRMEEAERLFREREFYKAKEVYREVQDYLSRVQEEAAGYKLNEHVEEIGSLINACQSNITSATLAMTQVEGVEVEIRRVGGIARARARFREAPMPIKNRTLERLAKLYAEVEYIGGGGFADVYRCVTREGGVVAVKVPRNIDEKTEEIFFREVSRWQQLNHRNIIRLIRPRLKPPCIELEYADGGSLYELLREKGRLEVRRACEIAYDVASALEYSHSKGILHTDINPKNILLSSTGEAKLTDFGLAKVVGGSSGVWGYTLPYAAPEQLRGKTPEERTDVYQLGLTLYVMLSGENPFDAGDKRETESRVESFLPEKIAGVEDELNEFILRCLAKDARERPTAREFKEFIYSFMKRRYNVSLHLTKDWRKECELALRNAIYAAKECDYSECLASLSHLRKKVHDPELREELEHLHGIVEYRYKERMKLADLVDGMEALLRRL